ncbi:hypothetical protein VTN77DRAFT_9382 [Rasamsonia byssochlamydoides]|uniref:uncharacterized protein n=1 Tax=Rasamsonia byssochlamydoides TaxID=89139 RepID=UPI003743450B
MDGVQESSPNPSSAGGFKKVFSRSNRSQTTSFQDLESVTSSSRSNGRSSVDSTSEMPRPKTSGDPAADDSSKGISKLLANRRKKKNTTANNNRLSASTTASADSSNQQSADGGAPPSAEDAPANGSGSAQDHSGGSNNLLTDDSEPDQTPPLVSRDSHTGYLTASSPLITTTMVDGNGSDAADMDAESPSRRHSFSATEPFPGFLGVTATASGPPLPESSKKRSVSPARRLRDAFTPSQDKKSPSVSPDRRSSQSSGSRRRSLLGSSSRRNSLSENRAARRVDSPPPPLPPLKILANPSKTDERREIRTPPATSIPAVVTTVTPPTPTEPRSAALSKVFTTDFTASPESIKPKISEENLPPGTVVSPSGNMMSHRRVRSASAAAAHPPSKLSQSTTLSQATEESRPSGSRTPSAIQSGFFSSMFSAAQNAASTISSSLGAQAKNRSVTQPPDMGKQSTDGTADGQAGASSESDNSRGKEQRKELAVNTLGSGDLNFSHLDIDAPTSGVVTTKDGVVITKPDMPVETRKSAAIARRDEMSARIEDLRAAKAISLAYEKSSSDRSATPPAAGAEDGGGVDARSSGAPLTKETSGEQTPSGSVIDGETGGIKRNGSVRSRLAKRRHRGSSGATGSTTAANGTSAVSLGVPGANSSVPRLTGFAVASKKRNRDFHQLFRSVPEDDFLIEDYSCALQREIILAGRIYISEGHICFSSNILGWVTTLVISFDEIVAIEKENTAVVFPNAIAIQTLHARHTFRSLLSREATYDLMVNIWKINHPSLKSYVNGVRIDQGLGDKTEKADESDAASDEADEDDEIYDEDEDNEGMGDLEDAGEGSIVGSETAESNKPLSRKTSANGLGTTSASVPSLSSTTDAKNGDKNGTAKGDASGDFPGPATHAPTELNDPAGRYDKVVKDDIIPAPLGQVYNMVFGPASGAFMTKFLVEEQKSTELQFEDDKKGLNNDNKTRQYSYIKPLNGSIGPKQTKCISTETLDFFDLEKAVLVTLSTQTPDVPSGNVFCVKTKYLFTWAAGNQTRFFMSCAIEWSGKSWLKGPIEKGAIDGQTSFGNDLVKALKAAVAPRGRTDGALKSGKAGKGRRKKGGATPGSETKAAAAAAATAALEASKRESQSWGVLEPLREPLGPVISALKPLWSAHVALGIIALLLFTIYSRGPAPSPTISPEVGYRGLTMPQRLAAYEEMWRREETELWNWLEERVGMDGFSFPVADSQRARRQKLRSKDLAGRLDEVRMTEREMDHAIRVTRERLDILEEIVNKRKDQRRMAERDLDESS